MGRGSGDGRLTPVSRPTGRAHLVVGGRPGAEPAIAVGVPIRDGCAAEGKPGLRRATTAGPGCREREAGMDAEVRGKRIPHI